MSNVLEKTGKIVFLRAHDLGTRYGPPNDQLDVEAVFILNAINDGAYGFQLRNDNNLPARQAMFSLLRDAFVNNLAVTADFLIDPGKKNGVAIRIALTHPQTGPVHPIGPVGPIGPVVSGSPGGQVLPGSSTT
ncbi:MAG: hypothetical protein KGN84_04320 [Acidobacteriota bacterium]|nr:hypothetical protein [Acidobacteriota bacterium]